MGLGGQGTERSQGKHRGGCARPPADMMVTEVEGVTGGWLEMPIREESNQASALPRLLKASPGRQDEAALPCERGQMGWRWALPEAGALAS